MPDEGWETDEGQPHGIAGRLHAAANQTPYRSQPDLSAAEEYVEEKAPVRRGRRELDPLIHLAGSIDYEVIARTDHETNDEGRSDDGFPDELPAHAKTAI